jgi:hypothetical protein
MNNNPLIVIKVCELLDKNYKFSISDKLFSKISSYYPSQSGLALNPEDHEFKYDTIAPIHKNNDKFNQGEPTESGGASQRKRVPDGFPLPLDASDLGSIQAQLNGEDSTGEKYRYPAKTPSMDALNHSGDPLEDYEWENRSSDPAITRIPENRVL